MRRSLLVMCTLLAVATSGCDKIKGVFTKKRGTATQTRAAADAARRDSIARAQAAAQQPPPAPPPPAPSAARPVRDMPYTSEDTGTVAPGMAERDVYALWGPPQEVRRAAEWIYIYYPNGCERTCGTADVVILQNGQVVDAIVRWPGHGYSGQSSSPPGRTPAMTQPQP